MARPPCTYRKRDVRVAIEAAQEAGARVAEVIIKPTGEIVLKMRHCSDLTEDEAGTPEPEVNEWDELVKTSPL